MSEQIPFDYELSPSNGIIEGEANQQALRALRRKNWPSGRLALIAPPKAGKTAIMRDLAALGVAEFFSFDPQNPERFIGASPIIVIDDFDRFIEQDHADEAVFHLLNHTAQTHQKVLIASAVPLSEIEIKLADLRSRLSTFESYRIDMPDDWMLHQLLAKGFSQRGLLVKPDVLEYLAKRIERSYEEIEYAVQSLDQMAMREKGKVNKARVRRYLDSISSPAQSGE